MTNPKNRKKIHKSECGYCVGEFYKANLSWNEKLETWVCDSCGDELRKQEKKREK